MNVETGKVLIALVFLGLAGYGWINDLEGWGWWLFGFFLAI